MWRRLMEIKVRGVVGVNSSGCLEGIARSLRHPDGFLQLSAGRCECPRIGQIIDSQYNTTVHDLSGDLPGRADRYLIGMIELVLPGESRAVCMI